MIRAVSQRQMTLILQVAGLLLVGFLVVWGEKKLQLVSPAPRPQVTRVNQPGERSPALSIFQPDSAFTGFTTYPVDGSGEVLLLNMSGRTVHSWKVDVERARLLPNGHLLVVHGSKLGRRKNPWKKLRDTIIEYDWNGNVVWKYEAADVVHHDVHRLPNGNTLFLRRTIIPPEYQAKIRDVNRRNLKIRSDSVVEIDSSGERVWTWHAHEHLDINSCGKRGCNYLSGSVGASDKAKDWTHMNTASVIPKNRWYKAGDSRFRPGNLIVLPRNWWEVFIIDRSSGEVVWRYNNDYRGGLSGGHEAHMIPEHLPGAGNILLFDNGSSKEIQGSAVLEVNPVTMEIVWSYEADGFSSRSRGSVQRLPNGNTLISEDNTGRTFEVTPEKQIVWEFRGGKETNRAHRYPVDYAPQFRKLPVE